MPDLPVLPVTAFIAASRRRSNRDKTIAIAKALLGFLARNGLARGPLLKPDGEPDLTRDIRQSDLTDEGNELMGLCLSGYFGFTDRGGDPANVSILEKALRALRERTAGAAPAGSAAPPQEPAAAPASPAKLARPRSRPASRRPPRPKSARASAPAAPGASRPTTVYDKAKFHSDGQFPDDLAPENGGTHIGMFLAWAVLRDLVSEELAEDAADDLAAVRERRLSGRELLFTRLDGGLCSDDLNDDGNAFAERYYLSNAYAKEYEALFAGRYPTCYHVADTPANFDLVVAMIDARYNAWKAARGGSPAGRPPAEGK